MDLQQLRYVVEVAATSSFTRAAERCFVTQSALSHQIAALERELGERLFHRSSRAVRLTEAGEAFLRHARVAVLAADEARDAVSDAGGRLRGTLRVGVIPTVAAVRVPAVVAMFRDEHPDVRVELIMGNSDALVADVRRGVLDVGLLGLRTGTAPVGVGYRELAVDRHVAVLPPRHRLARRGRLRLRDLALETFADFPSGSSGRAQSDVAFAAAGVERDVAFEVGTAQLLLDLVAEGLCVALLDPATAAQAAPEVTVRPLVDGPGRTEYVAWHADEPRRVARAFLDVVGSAASSGRRRGGSGESSGSAPVSRR